MDDWKYSGRADQIHQAEENEALRSSGMKRGRRGGQGPQPKTVEMPLTAAMRAIIRRDARSWAIKWGSFTVILVGFAVSLPSLTGGVRAEDRLLVYSVLGVWPTVLCVAIGIWFVGRYVLDLRRGTFLRMEGTIRAHYYLISAGKEGSGCTYMLNIGGRDVETVEAAYDAASALTYGTVDCVPRSQEVFSIRDRDGKIVYRHPRDTSHDAASPSTR